MVNRNTLVSKGGKRMYRPFNLSNLLFIAVMLSVWQKGGLWCTLTQLIARGSVCASQCANLAHSPRSQFPQSILSCWSILQDCISAFQSCAMIPCLLYQYSTLTSTEEPFFACSGWINEYGNSRTFLIPYAELLCP